MSIPKFRLAWKGGAQEQMNILEKMALLLENIYIELQRANGTLTSIDNRVGSIDIKMDTQIMLSQQIYENGLRACDLLENIAILEKDQLLLSQQIADNTNCACTALGDVNGKLDEIIDKLGNSTPEADYYFFLNSTNYQITQDNIDSGVFYLTGRSTKDGADFNMISALNGNDIIDRVEYIGDNTMCVFCEFSGLIAFSETIELQQGESGIIQSFVLSYTAPTASTYMFSYNADGGNLAIDTPEGRYQAGTEIILGLIEKDGYMFTGYTSPAFQVPKFGGEVFIMPENDVIVTANWVKFFSLTYMPDGGILAGGSGNGDYLEGDVIILPDVFKSGYEFKGFTSDAWVGYLFSGDTFTMPSYDLVISASFEVQPVVLTLVNSGVPDSPFLDAVVFPMSGVPYGHATIRLFTGQSQDVTLDGDSNIFVPLDDYNVYVYDSTETLRVIIPIYGITSRVLEISNL